MKSNQLVSLVIVLVVAGLLAMLFSAVRERQVERVGEGSQKVKVLPGFPVNEVAAVTIASGEDDLHLERQEGIWRVRERGGYWADFEKVSSLLRNVYDLGVVERVAVGPTKKGRVGLVDPGQEGAAEEEKPMVLTFRNEKGDEVAALWLGKEYKREEQSQFGSFDRTAGRYVKRPKEEEVYLVSEEFAEAKTTPADWVDKAFFQVSKVKSVERVTGEADKGWKLTRESDTGDFTLVDAKEGEKLDNNKVSSMKNAFSSPSFEDVVVGEDVEKPAGVTFKVETFEGFRYEVTVGEKSEANEYLLTVDVSAELPKAPEGPEGESEEDKAARRKAFDEEQKKLKEKLEKESRLKGFVYKVRGFVADSIHKDRAEILEEKAEAEAGTEGAVPGLEGPVPGLEGPVPGLGPN